MSELRDVPLALLDPSPFEARSVVEPLEDKEVITPLIVRAKPDGRFEVIAGHRRLETLKREGKTEAPCRIFELTDEQAATYLFRDNVDRQDLSDYEWGQFYEKYMTTFKVGERETERRLGVSHTTISRCVSIVKSREKVVTPGTISDTKIYESVVTAHKFQEANSLPEEHKVPVLQAVVENRLSTQEVKDVVAKVKTSKKPVDVAVTEVVNRRETRNAESYAHLKRHETCPTCGGRGWILKGETDG